MERKQAYWDDIAESFASDGHSGLWRRHSDRVNNALLAEWLPDRRVDRLLKTDLFDEATSGGLYPFLADRCSRFDGVDISLRAVEAAARKYPDLEARQGDLRALPFEDRAFDCVVSNSTLDHFQDVSDIHLAVGELFRVTRPGGHLLVTMDNLQNPVVWLRNHLPLGLLRKTGVVPYYVGRTLSHSGLVKAVQDAGYEVLDSTAIIHCPRVFSVARASAIERRGDRAVADRFLEKQMRWERLRRWPSRYFSGYFVAVKARRPA